MNLRIFLLVSAIAFGLVVSGTAAYAQILRPNSGGKSTSAVMSSFKPVIAKQLPSIVRVLVDDKDAALGTIITIDGFILTKASEIKPGKIVCKLKDGRQFEAKQIATNDNNDLLMLKIEADDLVPVDWSLSKNTPVGNWVATPGLGDMPLGIGVVSVAVRTVPPPYGSPKIASANSGFLGIALDFEGEGAVIGAVTPGGAAEKAGLKAKDIVLFIDDHEIINPETLINTLLGYRAGDQVKIMIERNGKRFFVDATLDKRPEAKGKGKGASRGDIQNSMGSTLSERRSGFPTFLQHDTVVKPTDCGGPLVDLEGRVIGVNIARAGRTESYAIPSEVIIPLLPDLLAGKSSTKPTNPTEHVKAAREALKKAEAEQAIALKRIADAKAYLAKSLAEEKFFRDNPPEKGPTPREVTASK